MKKLFLLTLFLTQIIHSAHNKPFLKEALEFAQAKGESAVNLGCAGIRYTKRTLNLVEETTRWGAGCVYRTCRPSARVFAALIRSPFTTPQPSAEQLTNQNIEYDDTKEDDPNGFEVRAFGPGEEPEND